MLGSQTKSTWWEYIFEISAWNNLPCEYRDSFRTPTALWEMGGNLCLQLLNFLSYMDRLPWSACCMCCTNWYDTFTCNHLVFHWCGYNKYLVANPNVRYKKFVVQFYISLLSHLIVEKIAQTSGQEWGVGGIYIDCYVIYFAEWCFFPSFSIIPTAFFATTLIFVCFTLCALWAEQRAFLYLGGKTSVAMYIHVVLSITD